LTAVKSHLTKMHELTISAIVADADHGQACKILQGVCAMPPTYSLRRRLVFQRLPTHPKGFSVQQTVGTPRQKLELWRELSEVLKQNSYTLVALFKTGTWDFTPTVPAVLGGVSDSPARAGPAIDLNRERGDLRWSDALEPPGSKPYNSSRIITIRDELNLITMLRSNSYEFKVEQVQECYEAVSDNVRLCLSRILQYPGQEPGERKSTEPALSLPTFDSLHPFDPENKWVLTAIVEVFDSSQPAQMQQAVEELKKIRRELQLNFDFQLVNRRLFDTRST